MRYIDPAVRNEINSRFPSLLVQIVLEWADVSHTVGMDRILELEHEERTYDNVARITIDNSDNFFTREHLEGFACTCYYGYEIDGEEYLYPTAPLRVTRATVNSFQGGLTAEIRAKGLFDFLSEEKARVPFAATSGSGITISEHWDSVCNGTTMYVQRAASTAYEVGDWVEMDNNGYAYRCTTAGTTDSGDVSDPTTVPDETVSDGTVTWTCMYESTPFGGTANEVVLANPIDYHATDEDDLFNDYVPSSEYEIDETTTRRGALSGLLNLTACVCRVGDDGKIRVIYPTTGTDFYHYEYDLDGNTFYSYTQRRDILKPNRIVVKTPDTYATQYVGEATDYTYDYFPFTKIVRTNVSSDSQATEMAEILLDQVRKNQRISAITVPLNPAIELHDNVSITDERSGMSEHGNVKYINRRYDTKGLRFTIGFGEKDHVREALENLKIDEPERIVERTTRSIYNKVQRGCGYSFIRYEGGDLNR